MKLLDDIRKNVLGQTQHEVHFQKVGETWYYSEGKPELVVNLKEIEDLEKAEKNNNDFSEWEKKRIIVMHLKDLNEWYFSKYGEEVTDEKILKRLKQGHKPKREFKNPFKKKEPDDFVDGYQRYYWINEKWYKLNKKNIETNPIELKKLDEAYEKDNQKEYHDKGIWPIKRDDNKVYYIYLDEYEKDENQIEILEKGRLEQEIKLTKFASEIAKVRPPIETLDQLMDCIHEWQQYQYKKGLFTEFYGYFYSINPKKNYDIEEDRQITFGAKETLLIGMDEHRKAIKKSKEEDDFINW